MTERLWGRADGGWCACGHHSIRHDADGCTVSFCGCKRFAMKSNEGAD